MQQHPAILINGKNKNQQIYGRNFMKKLIILAVVFIVSPPVFSIKNKITAAKIREAKASLDKPQPQVAIEGPYANYPFYGQPSHLEEQMSLFFHSLPKQTKRDPEARAFWGDRLAESAKYLTNNLKNRDKDPDRND